jgi:hypothetical protein
MWTIGSPQIRVNPAHDGNAAVGGRASSATPESRTLANSKGSFVSANGGNQFALPIFSHYSTTPLLHYSITPLLHYSAAPSLPLLRHSRCSAPCYPVPTYIAGKPPNVPTLPRKGVSTTKTPSGEASWRVRESKIRRNFTWASLQSRGLRP